MKISKGSLVNGTYSLMRISGLTTNPSPADIEAGLQVADDYSQELKEDGLDLGWQYPSEYGESNPDDNSGITPSMAGPFKKLLFIQLCSFFGKEPPMAVIKTAQDGMRTLEQMLVSVPDAQNPPTLPFGSGNEEDYRDRTFYSEPPINNDALYVFEGDILNYSHDFSDWLVDATLTSVSWDTQGNGLSIGTDTFTNEIATAELTFNQVGGYFVTITATKTNSTDRITFKQNFVISDPDNVNILNG
jgi:hypothetical protein